MMGRRALRGVFGPALPHDVEEGRGETGGAWRERVWNLRREAFFDEGHQNGVVLVFERHFAKRQLPKDDADGVHVGAIIRGGSVEQLRRGPLDCALDGCGGLDADDGVEALDGGAEVAYLGDEVCGEHDVRALQVAVRDAAPVQVIDGGRYFPRVPETDVHWRRRHAAQRLVQTATAHPLHHINGI
jgi:hypothetical protein